MDLALIPFALRESDGSLVGVDEVLAGRSCGCICPSCGSRLLARRGQQRAWHFAHEHRAEGQATLRTCDFSWAVSVRQMARQLLPTVPELSLPPAVFPVFDDGLPRPQPEPTLTLPAPDVLALSGLLVDSAMEGIAVDAVFTTGNERWCLYFTHRGRPEPAALALLAMVGCRVIVVNLHGFADQVGSGAPSGGHRSALATFLSQDIAHKRWVAHPDLAQARAHARDLHMPLSLPRFTKDKPPPKPWERDMIERRRQRYPSFEGWASSSRASGQAVAPTEPEAKKFLCLACDHRWASHAKVPPCPHCGHAYTAIPDRI